MYCVVPRHWLMAIEYRSMSGQSWETRSPGTVSKKKKDTIIG